MQRRLTAVRADATDMALPTAEALSGTDCHLVEILHNPVEFMDHYFSEDASDAND
jgi:hypothetical protein